MQVYPNFPGTRLPEEGDPAHYIVGSDGMYLRKKLSWIDATVKLRRATMLDPVKTGVQLSVPPISGGVMLAAIQFFRHVYQTLHGSEAIMLLHYNSDYGWDYSVPEQCVHRERVKSYDANMKLEGYDCLGTIHSHGKEAAYHSPTDHRDEKYFDGIHITVGHCHAVDGVSLSGEVVVNNNRFPYGDLSLIEGLSSSSSLTLPPSGLWLSNGTVVPAADDYYVTIDETLSYRPVSEEEMSRVTHQFANVSSVVPVSVDNRKETTEAT